jgi:hypothetical protein
VQRIKGENEMKTSELTGAALDWAVAKCEGVKVEKIMELSLWSSANWHKYSTDWAQGGPIIERGKIGIDYSKVGWIANADTPTNAIGLGSTPLVAAMRCYVASKLGDEVEIPEELT